MKEVGDNWFGVGRRKRERCGSKNIVEAHDLVHSCVS